MRLSHRDLTRVLGSISILHADDDPATLPSRTNDCVRYLISTDILAFEGFGTDSDYQGPMWFTPANSISDAGFTIMADLVTEHPCFEDVAMRRITGAVRVSDYMPAGKFKRTPIYNEFYRTVGTDTQMIAGLPVNSDLMISVSLCRLQKDYSDRDCGIFNMLTPHLVASFRNAQFANRLRAETEQIRIAFEATRYGVIVLDPHLRPTVESAIAIQMLAKYFDGTGNALPDEIIAYVRHQLEGINGGEYFLPPAPLKVERAGGRVEVRLHFNSATKSCVLLLQDFAVPLPSIKNSGSITARENEVLHWIRQGKTDSDIAGLLKISVRTVHKHVENIFNKLGVETRTAAASFAFDHSTDTPDTA